VAEEHDLAADLGPETAGGDELRLEEAPGKKAAGLLAEADDGSHGKKAGSLTTDFTDDTDSDFEPSNRLAQKVTEGTKVGCFVGTVSFSKAAGDWGFASVSSVKSVVKNPTAWIDSGD
jgi:hypothetical protein